MMLVRWKLLACLLGMSLCVLAAVADPTTRQAFGCQTKEAKVAEKPVQAIIPVVPLVEVPKEVVVVPVPPAPVISQALPTPSIPAIPDLAPPPPIPAPAFPATAIPAPAIPAGLTSTVPQVITIPALGPNRNSDLPAVPVPAVKPPEVQPPSIPAVQLPAKPEPTNSLPVPAPIDIVPEPVAKPARTAPSPATAGKPEPQVSLIVRLNRGLPTMQVMAGSTELMQVTADQIDLAARSQDDEQGTSIKLHGHVKFTAPGCSGTCEELTLNPRTWEGAMLRNVAVRCRQGASESELAAEKMVFRVRMDPENAVRGASHAVADLPPAR